MKSKHSLTTNKVRGHPNITASPLLAPVFPPDVGTWLQDLLPLGNKSTSESTFQFKFSHTKLRKAFFMELALCSEALLC